MHWKCANSKRIRRFRLLMTLGLAVPPSGVVLAQGAYGVLSSSSQVHTDKQAVGQVQRGKIPVTLTVQDSTIAYVVQSLASQARLRVFYTPDNPQFQKRISVRIVKTGIMDAYTIALKGTGLIATLASDGETVVIRSQADSVLPPQATGVVSGRVTDSATGRGVLGATVGIAGTKQSVTTGEDGKFSIPNISAGEKMLSVKVFGYKAAERIVSVNAGKITQVRFILSPIPTTLSGVVTTATGVQRKIEVGNDITTINVDSVMKVMPVSTMSDLLATRVPGMNVALTSGAPGAPSKIRIRGISSLLNSNDPIFIVDGIRVYAAQGNTGRTGLNEGGTLLENFSGGGVDRSSNMAAGSTGSTPNALVPSAIDMIDPNSIETIDVLKGPSAVALYGTDAANGVVVITTKRGVSGPAKWNASIGFDTEFVPGTWPKNYYMWGTGPDGNIGPCPIEKTVSRSCRPDSLITYQILNNPNTTTFGRGLGETYRADVRGGNGNLTYSANGAMTRTLGYLKMPDVDVALLESKGERVPFWQRRPQASEQQSGGASVEAKIRESLTAVYSASANRNFTRTTPLQGAITIASNLPPAGLALQGGGAAVGSGILQSISGFRKRINSRSLGVRNAADIRFVPTSAVNAQATFGFDFISRKDMAMIQRNDCVEWGCGTSLGEYNTGLGNSIATSSRMRVSHQHSAGQFITLRTSLGGDFTRTVTNDLIRNATDLPKGASSGNGAAVITARERIDDRTTAGVYLQTDIGIADRFFIPLALRQDAGSGIGGKSAPRFPKLAFSYVLSDQPAFDRIPVLGQLGTLRLRTAYGQSGIQPSVAVKTRGYLEGVEQINGISVPYTTLARLGDPYVRPERTQEIEGGIDMSAMQERLSLSVTFYKKKTRDALVARDLPLSLGSSATGFFQTNLGQVDNTGLEVSFGAGILETRTLSWKVDANFSRNRNLLVSLGLGRNLSGDASGSSQQRFVEGYPLNGRWARPVIGYSTIEVDGTRVLGDVVLADSSIYLGGPLPNYTVNLQNTITIFSRLSVNARFSYEDGMNQVRANNGKYSQAINDPAASFPMQAYTTVYNLSEIGFAQTVSSLRFDALSVNYSFPNQLSKRIFVGRQVSIALQGRNLGLKSNYRGKDPNVSNSMSDIFRDDGALSRARSWGFTMRFN